MKRTQEDKIVWHHDIRDHAQSSVDAGILRYET
jgi:hypothetical protein